MKKTILIPTDFSLQSLNILKVILNANSDKQVYDVILLHGFSFGDSIRDLLFYSKAQQLKNLINSDFEEACEVIRNKFNSQIGTLRIDLFSGCTTSAFNNYLEANNVGHIYTCEAKPIFKNRKSFDLNPFINKCSSEVIKIELDDNISTPEKGKIAEVFTSQISVS